jgi:hypothetical protein
MVGVVHPVDGGQLLRHLQLLRLEILQNAHTIQYTHAHTRVHAPPHTHDRTRHTPT